MGAFTYRKNALFVQQFWVDGQPNQGGDCSHLDLSKMDNFILKSNTLYWGNSTFIHESLVLEEEVKRQLVRVTLPADAEELI